METKISSSALNSIKKPVHSIWWADSLMKIYGKVLIWETQTYEYNAVHC
jgi:hypothetical protein